VEIESLAAEHSAVMQAAAIGVPDEKWGERPVLIVVPQPESSVSEREILALYDGRVAKWCVPVRVIFVESLPVSGTGKVQKNILRELYTRHARPEAM
jgi:fatty-acyl-CoA synthase